MPPLVVNLPAANGRAAASNPTLPQLVVPAGLDAPYRITAWDATIGDNGVSHLSLTLTIPPPSKPGVPSNLYLMQLLTDLQNKVAALSTSTYGAGHDYATIVVAAENSRSVNADFVCAGFTDEQTINLALAALPVGGGKIVLLDGTYNTAAPIRVEQPRVSIEGMGESTIIIGSLTDTISDDYDIIRVRNVNTPHVTQSVTIRNLVVTSHADMTRTPANIGVIHLDGTYAPFLFYPIGDVWIENVVVGGFVQCYGILGSGGVSNVDIHGCIFNGSVAAFGENPGGIFFDNGGAEIITIADCLIIDTWGAGIEFQADGGRVTITGNYIAGQSAAAGIELGPNCGDVAITGNFVFLANPCIAVRDQCSDIAIVGNELIPDTGSPDPGAISVLIEATANLTTAIAVTGNDLSAGANGVALVATGTGHITAVTTTGNVANFLEGFIGYFANVFGVRLSGNVTDCVVSSNVLTNISGRSPGLGYAIELDNGASDNLITGNMCRDNDAGILIADSSCVHNLVTNNYCAPLDVIDHGTNTVLFGNLVTASFVIDGGGVWAAGTGAGAGYQTGGGNTATGDHSLAEGYGADAYEEGQVAHASTLISHAGDAQASEVTAAAITFDATPTVLANRAGNRLVALPDGERTVEFEIVLVARQAP